MKFIRNPASHQYRPRNLQWEAFWNSCKTSIGLSTSSTRALTFYELYKDYNSYCTQNGTIPWSEHHVALDLMNLISVDLVQVVGNDWTPTKEEVDGSGTIGA